MKEVDFAATYGLALSTIRFYCERGLLRPATLKSGLFFTADDAVRIQIIAKGRRLGFSIDEIQELIESRSGKPKPPL